MEYTSLEQLIATRYLDALSDYADVDGQISVLAQNAVRSLLSTVYSAIAEDPKLLFASLHDPDIYHNRYNKSSENKPELYGLIKRAAAAIDGVVANIAEISKASERAEGIFTVPKTVKIKQSHIAVFNVVGITIVKTKTGFEIDPGKHTLAFEMLKCIDVDLMQLSYGIFSNQEKSIAAIYRRNLGDPEAFDMLIEYLAENGYYCQTMREDQLNLDYAKDYGKKATPLKSAWGERNHGGVSFAYHRDVEPAFICALRIPANKVLLTMADRMPLSLRGFVVRRNTKCSGCRYCVQTDKTGARPLIYIPVEHDGETHNLCPNFPGFAFTFEKLDIETVTHMIEYLRFIDENISEL